MQEQHTADLAWDRAALTRLENQVMQSLVPIFSDLDDQGRFEFFGTGVLFAHRGHGFVITTSHVATRLADVDSWNLRIEGLTCPIALQLTRTDAEDTKSETFRYVYTQENVDLDYVDIGLLELSEQSAKWVANANHRFLTRDTIADRAPESGDRFAIIGYPAEYASAKTGKIRTDYLALLARQYTGSLALSERNANRDIHLMLEHQNLAVNSSGQRVEVPDLEGMSGCAAWLVPEKQSDLIFVPDPSPKLFAIQTSYRPGSWIQTSLLNIFLSDLINKFEIKENNA